MNISSLNFKGITRFGYDDEQSSIKRVSIRKHINDKVFQSHDVFIKNPRLEEYELNKLIGGLTKRGAIRKNPKSAINLNKIRKLPLYNVKPIDGTSSYRGGTANIDSKICRGLKRAGIKGIITFLSYSIDQEAVREHELEFFRFPIEADFWGNDIFKARSDVVKKARENFFMYKKFGYTEEEFINGELQKWEYEKTPFRMNFVKFIQEMQKPNRYVGCACGEARTDEMMTFNYLFNPNAINSKCFANLKNKFFVGKAINLYDNLTPEDKKQMGWDEDFDKNFIPRFKKWAPEVNI